MYRTDKQFMTNPATASSRIYIGGLAKTIVAADLEEKFKIHGKILGLVLQMGFAFIQFENESQSQAAIKNENNTMLHGRKISVRQALDKSQKGNNPNQNQRGPNMNNQNQNRRQGQGPHHPGQGQGPYHQNQGQGPPHSGQGQGPHHPNQGQGPHHPNQGQGPHPNQGQGPHHNQGQGPHHPNQGQGPHHPNQGQGPHHPGQGQGQGPQHPGPGQGPHYPNQGPGPAQGQTQGPPPAPQVQNNPPAHKDPSPAPQPNSGPVDESPKPAQKSEPEKEPQNDHAVPPGPPNLAPKNPPSVVDEPPKTEGLPEKRPRKRRVRSRDRFQPVDMYRDDPYYNRDDYHPPGNYGGRPPVLDQPDRNDCEIIVVSKALTKYAEYIEQRLKALGLIVDLLFPNEDVPIGRVLANISSRGCLYAILVMPQNEEHRSLTLNILHGIPQEHRNMPIEDALVLITRNFDAYMRGDKTTVETLGPGGVLNVSDRHPTSMQLLLNLLAENRQITSAQYDRLLKYLQERREVQHQHEVDEGVDQLSQESNTKQAELQSRIMNILNKAATDNLPPPPEEKPQPAEVAPPLLKDPSVQKALDSLLGGEMFKNISAAL